jgi:chromosome segregation ATPase
MAKKTKAELINEIKELQETVRCGDEMIGKQASKIKQLRVLWRDTDIESVEKGCKIKELHDENKNLSAIIDRKRNDYNDINELRNGAIQRSADKTKQIKQLQADYDNRQAIIAEMSKEIKELKAVAIEMRNEVNNLQADLEFANTAHRDKDIEISRLRVLLRGGDQIIDENAKEISNLDQAVAELGSVIADKDSKINDLEDVVRANDALISRQVKEIQGFELVCDAKANAIKELQGTLKIVRDINGKNVYENGQLRQELATSRDFSDKQADVIRNYLKQIADLERRLELSEKFSGNREFHNATEAMGNPLYFQGVK